MSQLNENLRNWAIGQLETGVSISEVVRHFHVQQCIIHNLWQCFQQRGVTTDLPCPGRPRITARVEDFFMVFSQHNQLPKTSEDQGISVVILSLDVKSDSIAIGQP
ncbi:transposable element tcb2 transposase [Plakobranchus ocellatus]|uniref:Transposable element tcb2 transposase n=1 Tax=Plakobranchus ocellatus TaxID=259542 RepID=A0AAV4E027_9GAST|nr:transposable element tcb2 transposase [Plakobranchus ocellatus]